MRKRKWFTKTVAGTLAVCMVGGTAISGVGPVNVKAADPAEEEWQQIQDIVSRYYGEFKDESLPGQVGDEVGGWGMYLCPDTALMGNGDIGVHSGGKKGEKTFYISKSDFWKMNDGRSQGAIQIAAGGYTIKGKSMEADANENLAPKCKKVTYSTNGNVWGIASLQPEYVVSGDFKMNGGEYGWVSAPCEADKPEWFQLEYENPITVKRYSIYNDGAARAAEAANNTSSFEFQYSNDGTNWETADTVTGNAENVCERELDKAVTAKFFRIYITEPVQPGTPNPRARLAQWELYSGGKETGEETPVKFYEKQDILNAEVTTEMGIANQPVEMKTFTSANENIVVTELTSRGDADIQIEADIWTKSGNAGYPNSAEIKEDNTIELTRASSTAKDANTSEIAIASKIVGDEYKAEKKDDATGAMEFTLSPDETVYVVSAVGGGGRTYKADGSLAMEDPTVTAANLLADINTVDDVKKLNTEHKEWWKDYWSASYIDFGREDANLDLLQKYYYGAQYILGCASREGKVAPGINGIWTTTDRPMWSNRYQLNYNYNAAFYGAGSSNRASQGVPGFVEMLKFMPEGQRRSASINELRRIDGQYVNDRLAKGTLTEAGIPGGMLFPCALGPNACVAGDSYQKEPMYAAYSAFPGTEYYQYTKDEKFLEEKLYDYLKSCAVFYETWLEKDENGQYNIYAAHNEESWSYNAAVELGAVYSLFTNLVDASITLDKDADKRDKWIEIRDNLAPHPTTIYNGKEVYALAEKTRVGNQYVDLSSPIPGDGNALVLELLLQGERLGYFSPDEELQIARDTIDVFGDKVWQQQNNFSRLYPSAVRARYSPEKIIEGYMSVIKYSMQGNLRIKDGAHGIEKSGSTLAINEMLALSDQGITKVFPNWLKDKDAKFANLRVKGAFLISSEYDAALRSAKYVDVTSEKGGTFTLVNPWASDVVVTDSKGNVVPFEEGTVPNWKDEKTITFETKAGETYSVNAKDGIPEKVYLSKERVDLKSGVSEKLDASTTKGSAIKYWESDNKDVVTVTKDGQLKALKAGTAIVKAGISDSVFATCKVVVTANEAALKAGETKDLNAYIPEGENVAKWESSDTNVAVVSKDGVVQARNEGTADIVLETDKDVYGLCHVIVAQNEVKINRGRTVDLAPLAESFGTDITWESSNNEAAVVGKDGMVSALNEGETVVSIKSGDTVVELCKVIVTPLSQGGNVAVGGRAYASDVAGNFTADRAICGGEIAGNYEGWVTSPMDYNTPRWWAVELPGEYSIERWVVTHDGHRDTPDFNTKDFKLQSSNDGETWTDVDVVTGNTEDKTDRTLSEPVRAKYFRIYITAPEQKVSGSTRGRLRQVELYAESDKFEELSVTEVEKVEAKEVESGTAFEDLNLPGQVSVKLSSGNFASVDVEWNKGSYNGDAAGEYTLVGALQLPTGIVNPEELSAEITVTVKASEVEADKDDLAALIGYANSQKDSEDYEFVVPAVKKAFEKALAEAVAVNEKANATQAEVDAAYDKLLDMVGYLEFTGNSTSLKVTVDAAKKLNPDRYTEESWAVLEEELAKAEAVLADENALQAEIDAANDALNAAMKELVIAPVDKSALEKLVKKAKKYEDKIDQYTTTTAGIFTEALAAAREVLANDEATQKDIDAAYGVLQNAMFNLRLIPNKDKLDDLIKAAEKVDTSKYTDESVAAFKAALDNAKAVFADEDATEESVKAAEKALKTAQKNLVAKADAKSQPKTGDTASIATLMSILCGAIAAAGIVIIRRKRR